MWWTRKKKAPKVVDSYAPEREAELTAPPHRNAFLMVALGGAAVAAFGIAGMRSIFAPVFFALVLTICVHPLRTTLEQRGVPRGIATGSVITAVVLLLGGFGWAFLLALGQFAALLPQYGPQLAAFASSIASALSTLGFGQEQINDFLSGFDPTRLIGFFTDILGSVAGLTTSVVIVLTMLILMAMDAAFIPTLFKQLGTSKPLVVKSMNTYASGVRRYMVVTTVLGAAQGLVNWAALAIIGVPGAALWGMLSFLCSFIPNIGYFIAIIPPLVFALLTGGWPMVIAVLIVYAVINGVIQSVIQPRVVGGAVALSQSITFFSVLFWALLIGPIGAILAIPLSLLVRALLIDSNPAAWWWRPVIGDLDETRQLMKEEDGEMKAAKVQRKADKRLHGAPTTPGA
jgi:predicted PurR-regulated permease PerM